MPPSICLSLKVFSRVPAHLISAIARPSLHYLKIKDPLLPAPYAVSGRYAQGRCPEDAGHLPIGEFIATIEE